MSQAGSGKVVRIRGRSRAGVKAAAASSAKAPIVARDAIAMAFEAIGGVAAFAEWIKASEDNRKTFYTNLYPKIFGSRTGPDPESQRVHKIERVIVDPAH